MNKNKALFYIISITFFSFSCQKEKLTQREFPQVEIIDEVIQDENGITFTANIISEGNSPIIEKGFVWDRSTPTLSDSKAICNSKSINIGNFSATSKIDFQLSQTYYVKAYIQTEDFLVLSEPFIFESNFESPYPVINTINPNHGTYNDIIEIHGNYFSFKNDNLEVYFNGKKAIIVSHTDSLIKIRVPQLSSPTRVTIRVSVLGKVSVSGGGFDYQN